MPAKDGSSRGAGPRAAGRRRPWRRGQEGQHQVLEAAATWTSWRLLRLGQGGVAAWEGKREEVGLLHGGWRRRLLQGGEGGGCFKGVEEAASIRAKGAPLEP